MARLGSWDIEGFPTTWFDVDGDVSGWVDRDVIPFPKKPPPPPPPPPPPAPSPSSSSGGSGGGWWGDDQRLPPLDEEKWKHPFGPPDYSKDPLSFLRREPPGPPEDSDGHGTSEPVFAIVEIPVPVYYETKGRETFTVVEVPAEAARDPEPVPATTRETVYETVYLPAQLDEELRSAMLGLLDDATAIPEPTKKMSPWVWVAAGAVVLAAGIAIGVALSQPSQVRPAQMRPRQRRRKTKKKQRRRR